MQSVRTHCPFGAFGNNCMKPDMLVKLGCKAVCSDVRGRELCCRGSIVILRSNWLKAVKLAYDVIERYTSEIDSMMILVRNLWWGGIYILRTVVDSNF